MLGRFISALNSTSAHNAFLEGNIRLYQGRYLFMKRAHKLIEALNERARQGKPFHVSLNGAKRGWQECHIALPCINLYREVRT